MKYCPKCKSCLYPIDEEYMAERGMCSYCCTYTHRLTSEDIKKLRDKKRQRVTLDDATTAAIVGPYKRW
jgi:DNA-directed RNA polymerase subunit M/transcription elongation factor TFIIS